MAGLLYAKSVPINDAIQIRIPKMGEVLDSEDEFFGAVSTLIATPYDMMVQLDDAGVDFTKINDFELFCLTYRHLREMDTSILFGDLDFKGFKTAVNQENDNVVLWNPETNVVIDRVVHDVMATTIRRILHTPKVVKRPGNEEARMYMIERARRKQRRMKKKKESPLENYIVALVNNEQFPYDYEGVKDITIYQFYSSLNQIAHKIKYDNTMVGVYAGTIKFDDLSKDDQTWILSQQ